MGKCTKIIIVWKLCQFTYEFVRCFVQDPDDVPAADEAVRDRVARANERGDFANPGLNLRHRMLRDRRKSLARGSATGKKICVFLRSLFCVR